MESLIAKLQVSTNYVCYSCSTRCDNLAEQKEHYKSEWHRYNLKRGVAELPSITLDEYNERFPQQSATAIVDQPKSVFDCEYCKKTFHSQKSFDNHCASKKHLDKKKKLAKLLVATNSQIDSEQKIEVEAVEDSENIEHVSLEKDSDNDNEWEDLESDYDYDDDDDDVRNVIDVEHVAIKFSPEDCLFCVNHNSAANIEDNLEHMKSEHFFIVPFREICTDTSALLVYLAKKIRVHFECVWCRKRCQTADGVLSHMKMKGHMEMCFLGSAIEEYVPFYDFSAYCSDSDETDDEIENDDQVDDDDDDVDDDVTDSNEIVAKNQRNNQDDIFAGCYSLTLPSGRSIGHRSLIRHYKQHFGPNYTGITIRSILRKNQRMANVMSQNRSLGWSGGVEEAKKRQHRDLKIQQVLQNKSKQKLSCKANKLNVCRPSVVF